MSDGMHQPRSMTREIGTAFAVLAIYLLTILAPLHHARASQAALQELGYAALDSGWVLCSTADDGSGEDRDALIAKCPAAGLGKPDMLAPGLDVVALDLGTGFVAAPLLPTVADVTPFAIASCKCLRTCGMYHSRRRSSSVSRPFSVTKIGLPVCSYTYSTVFRSAVGCLIISSMCAGST